MIDLEDLPVSTAEGRRPSSTGADRLMIGLAALALIGGGLIAVSRLLPPSDSAPVAEATATIEPSSPPPSTATPQPTSSPALRTFALASGEAPSETTPLAPYSGWARALRDVTIRPGTGWGFSESFVLQAGEAAYIEEQPDSRVPGMLQVHAPISGFVNAEAGGQAVFERVPYEGTSAGWLASVVSGPNGFAAVGSSPSVNNHAQLAVASSLDGTSWEVHETPVINDPSEMNLAHGPAGWLLTGKISTKTASEAWIWSSPDLRSWVALGRTAAATWHESGVANMVGTEAGYVMLSDGGFSGPSWTAWYSSDGVLWSERLPIDGTAVVEMPSLTATPFGFYLQGKDASGEPIAAFSRDGWEWARVDTTPLGQVDRFIGLAATHEGLVAVYRSGLDEVRASLGTVSGRTLTWRPDPSIGSSFTGGVVTSLVSDGATPVAFGWDRATDAALWWVREDAGWQRRTLPAGYHGIPRLAAAGPSGYVLVGGQPTSRGQNPVLWHYDGSGDWEAAAGTVMDAVMDPSPAECDGLGDGFLDILTTNGTERAACFGDAPITLRAFAAATCYRCAEAPSGSWETAWLSRPTSRNLLYLAPTTTGVWGLVQAVLKPSLAKDVRWEDRWVEVTAHYDDPASSSCRWTPAPADETWYAGRDDTVLQCRGRLVVDRVRVIPDQV